MTSVKITAPQRISTDDSLINVLRFAAIEAQRDGAALATLVEIRGGAARALGSHMAISSNGRFCGYVSGGCVEAAVACEALSAIREGQDRIVKFGAGSPFFDITLPCGGGITIAIHLVRDAKPIEDILRLIEARQATGLRYAIDRQVINVTEVPPANSGWHGSVFQTVYLPRTRLIVSGQGPEAHAVTALATVSGYEVVAVERIGGNDDVKIDIDPFTAVALLHHDIDAELSLLRIALQSPAFYIGALGSKHTHARRVERLVQLGVELAHCERLKAPIGLFGPTRDSNSLAMSVLADVAAARIRAASEWATSY